ncbi:alpha/beta hydrolase [Kitasatospora sp. NBC_01287]|uniref:alpha/beta fold hydrolase n=1 Tax=Kitasatospora sp. NBC_01287 TaxID=2903573 RepID=UPI00224C80C5|nr:alpha/beta hydrolase [Kitasatospora sp. NBC_01287]MCX4745582.1 alpha/beta hydrolase [Kitasatospora sp. NBC_01287]
MADETMTTTTTINAEATAATALRADDGVRLWAVRQNEGKGEGRGGDPVVLCHGGPGLWDTLEEVAGLLPADRAAYRWDQRGAGRSERRGPYSVARSVADLEALRAHFGLERMVLLGHSWGAQLVLEYALAHPERVSALVYVSGTGIDHRSSWRERHERAHREALERAGLLERWAELDGRERTAAEDRELCVLQWSTDFADPGTALARAERMATPWYGVNFECNAAINAESGRDRDGAEPRARCGALTVPVLIVDGAEDPRPRDAVDSLEQALPVVSRAVLRGAGHLPWVEEPAGFRAAVGAFLAADRG